LKNNAFLAETPIGKLLLKLSAPAMVAMFAGALYNIVDTIFIGKGVGPLAIGGLAIAFPFQMIIMAVAQLFGIGAASVVSRNLGSGNRDRAYHTAGNIFFVSIIIGIITTTAGFLFLDDILLLFGATPGLMQYSKDYLSVILFGVPFITVAMSSNNLIRAEGNAKFSMGTMLIGTVVNIILDPIFIFGLNMGIKGAAAATVIAQIFSFSFLSWYFLSKRSTLKVKMHHLLPNISIIKESFILGFPSFIRQAGGSISIIIVNNSLQSFGGDLYIAIFGIIGRLMSFGLMPAFGIAMGYQPITGYNYGAERYNRVREVLKLSIKITTASATAFFLIVMTMPDLLLEMFTNDALLIKKGIPVLRIILMATPLIGLQVMGATFFQSIGKAVPSLLLGMSRQILFLIPLVLILPGFLGLTGVLIAFPIADISATIVTVLWMLWELKFLPNEIQKNTYEAA
jgi:putative MATE family efflux protein